MFSHFWLLNKHFLTFPRVNAFYRPSFSMCLLFILLNMHYFSSSVRFCLCIGHAVAGCSWFRCFGCSMSTSLAFPRVFLLVYWPSFSCLCMFLHFCCSIRTPSAFPCVLLDYWLLTGYYCFCASVCSISTRLAFPCILLIR